MEPSQTSTRSIARKLLIAVPALIWLGAGIIGVPAPANREIRGRVCLPDCTPINGVVMAGAPGNPLTNSGGYLASVPYDWSGTVTPTLAGYTFSPASRTYANVRSWYMDEDFTQRFQRSLCRGLASQP